MGEYSTKSVFDSKGWRWFAWAIRFCATMSRPRFIVFSSVALFLAYLLVGGLSYKFVIPPSQNAVFWMASGMTFAALNLTRRAKWLWPGWLFALFLGEFVLVSRKGIQFPVGFFWSLANLVEPLIVGLVSRRYFDHPLSFRKLSHVGHLLILTFVSVIPAALVAAIGAKLWLGVPSFWEFAFAWGTSDALGIILIAPMILAWTSRQSRPIGSTGEGLVLYALLATSTFVIFESVRPSPLDPSLPALLVGFVAWAAIRFGPRGTTLAIVTLELIAGGGTAQLSGPFALAGWAEGQLILNFQLRTLTTGLLMLVLSAVIEEQRSARLEAESAIQVRDDFLAIASHELNTPLTSLLLSFSSLLKMEGSPFLKNRLTQMERQSRRLARLVTVLLDVSRMGRAQMVLNLSQVELGALVESVIEQFKTDAEAVRCSLVFQKSRQFYGHWDAVRLEQVVANLVANALKFGTGKPVEISLSDVQSAHFHGVRLEVRDHGIGIPEARIPYIFNAYERAVSSGSYGGLGLGLFVVRKIVEGHHGTLVAENAADGGARVSVVLPLAERVSVPAA